MEPTASSGAARIDGGHDNGERRRGLHFVLGLGFARGGEDVGSEEKRGGGDTAAGGPPYLSGSRQHGMAPVEGTTATMGSVATREEEMQVFQKNPLEVLNELQFGPATGFNNLIEAPGHLYKMCKNSYRLHLTSRFSTKIGEVK